MKIIRKVDLNTTQITMLRRLIRSFRTTIRDHETVDAHLSYQLFDLIKPTSTITVHVDDDDLEGEPGA